MSAYDSFKYPAVTLEAAKSMGMTADEFERAKTIMGREPNYIELGCISAMWSEHCSYKSSRLHLRQLPTTGENVVYGPGENAGVVRVDGDTCICFKIESHNHPSFLDPFNGAATGIGGILRDVFTMGARPVAAMNSLRLGSRHDSKTPFLLKGAVEGMAYYGINFGVPTVGGEIYFDKCYNSNPLVNAFVLGLVKEDKIFTAQASGVGNTVIYIGAKTGMQGIHGASMASDEFSETSTKSSGVPVGDPFKEKQLFEACMELMQTDALIGIQDMGAAGLSSSSFEMAGRAGSGVIMHLDRVPLETPEMTPYEIMLSESQERMLLVAKKGREQEIIDTASKWELDAAVIGEVTGDGYVRLYWNGEEVAAIEALPLSEGAPVYDRPYKRPEWLDRIVELDESTITTPSDFDGVLAKLLNDPSIAGKRWVCEQLKADKSGSDAAMIKLPDSIKGVAMSVDCNSLYCYLNPRMGAMHAVAESARNVAMSGAVPVALTNCLNYGNPEKPEVMYQLVEGIKGIAEAAKKLNTPVVSGNVSLYNETEGKPIYPTPVIVVTGVIDDARNTIESSFRESGSSLIAVGKLPTSIAASHYLNIIHNTAAGAVPDVDLDFHAKLFPFMAEVAAEKSILSAHDVSEGGIAVALFEMGKNKGLGCDVALPAIARADALLFGEAPLAIIEVSPVKIGEVTAKCQKYGLPCTEIGKTTGDGLISIKAGSISLIKTDIKKLNIMYEKSILELVE